MQTNLDCIEKIIGGAKGDRTPDLNAASVALSQLSYGPKKIIIIAHPNSDIAFLNIYGFNKRYAKH